jgi:urease accessory protein
VEAGWVTNQQTLGEWLADNLSRTLGHVDIPLLARLYEPCRRGKTKAIEQYCELLLACRETRELREEEENRGKAMGVLLRGLGLIEDGPLLHALSRSQLAGFAYAAATWQIPLDTSAAGYTWAWLENQVIAGVKIIPLGQTAGQQLLLHLGEKIDKIVVNGLSLPEEEIGGMSPAAAIASANHETQYTRLYRS